MGSRANFVILGDHGLELYYDHWGAQGMSYDLLLAGPAATVSRIRSMRRLENLPEEWLDNTWAEGALVLDLGAQRLIWFEVAYEGMPPYLTAHLIERTWPGWTPVWAAEGMSAILAAVGVDAAPILGEPQEAWRDKSALKLLDTNVESWHTRDGVAVHDQYVMNGAVLSVRFSDGSIWSTAVGVDIDVIAELWWEWVVDYVARARDEGRTGAGPGGTWSLASSPDQPPGDWPSQGMFVDVPSREFHWWAYGEEGGWGGRFARNWPGFTVLTHADDFAWHERVAGISGIQPELGQVLRSERKAFVRSAERRRDENPSDSMATLLRERGHDVELSPWTAEYVSISETGNLAVVLREIDSLIESGATVLPATRHIDSRGQVVQPRG